MALTWRTSWTERAKVTTTVIVASLFGLAVLPFNVTFMYALGATLSNPATYQSRPAPTSRPPVVAAAAPASPVNPRGHLVVLVNADDSLHLQYTPDQAGDGIRSAQFWLRAHGRWQNAGEVANRAAEGAFEIVSVPDTASGRWKADDTAVSVHVLWPGGLQTVDPSPWVWRDHFGRAPLAPIPQDLQVSGLLNGQLATGINPHPQGTANPSPTGNVPTWTRCVVFGNSFEADIVGAVGSTTYALSMLDQDLRHSGIPGTYSTESLVTVTFAATDGTASWHPSGVHGSAAVTFADRASGSINAHFVGGQQPIDISGTWRCAGAGPVAAAIPPLPEVAQVPVSTPTPAPPTPTPTPVPATPTPPPAPAAPPPAPAPPPVAPPPPPPAPGGCYPHTNSGGCYQPGEFCRTSDHGASGRTASGEAIRCVNNNGWRWEPA